MLFPASPAVVAVTERTAPAVVADTPTLLPFPGRLMAAARFVAFVAIVALTAKVVPESTAPAVKMSEVAPFVIVTVSPGFGSAVKVPVSKAALGVADPARLVLNTT